MLGLGIIRPVFNHLTIPCALTSAGIFYADFGLFYQLPRDSGPLYDVTQVIDTYLYRALKVTGNVGMASAAGLYQSVVGFVLVMITNFIVRKIDPDSALF